MRRVRFAAVLVVSMMLMLAFAPSHSGARPRVTSSDPVIAAAGDISCRKPEPHPATGKCFARATSDLILAHGEVTDVLTLGDSQYPCGAYSQFLTGYDPTWGRMLGYTQPTVGNHEYEVKTEGCDTQASGYFQYFGEAALGPRAGPADGQDGYYYFDVAGSGASTSRWRIIVLNSNCAIVSCAPGSPQELFLQDAIATTPAGAHIMASWHQPLFNGSRLGAATHKVRPFWNDLYAGHAALILNAHAHYYERYARQDPYGNRDAAGLTEIIVGTGGASHGRPQVIAPTTEAWDSTHFGALFVTLGSSSFDWRFIATDGTVIDRGSHRLT